MAVQFPLCPVLRKRHIWGREEGEMARQGRGSEAVLRSEQERRHLRGGEGGGEVRGRGEGER